MDAVRQDIVDALHKRRTKLKEKNRISRSSLNQTSDILLLLRRTVEENKRALQQAAAMYAHFASQAEASLKMAARQEEYEFLKVFEAFVDDKKGRLILLARRRFGSDPIADVGTHTDLSAAANLSPFSLCHVTGGSAPGAAVFVKFHNPNVEAAFRGAVSSGLLRISLVESTYVATNSAKPSNDGPVYPSLTIVDHGESPTDLGSDVATEPKISHWIMKPMNPNSDLLSAALPLRHCRHTYSLVRPDFAASQLQERAGAHRHALHAGLVPGGGGDDVVYETVIYTALVVTHATSSSSGHKSRSKPHHGHCASSSAEATRPRAPAT